MFDVVLPLKMLPLVKSRLAPVLTECQRTELAIAMATDVLDALAKWKLVREVRVIAGPGWPESVLTHSAKVLPVCEWLPQRQDLNAAIQGAALGDSHTPILVLHADLPSISACALDHVGAAFNRGVDALVAPDRHGEGTNMVAFRSRQQAAYYFGRGSLSRHINHFRQAALSFEIVTTRAFGHDIDTPSDLQTLFEDCRNGLLLGPATRIWVHQVDASCYAYAGSEAHLGGSWLEEIA